ncbi:hypothetical protein, partial [[Mycoplasma] collis]|uniref:hypothetical protein n=1 Tax=[Mycoplasma] collis TaxID=2127 RepID=UPI00051C9B0C
MKKKLKLIKSLIRITPILITSGILTTSLIISKKENQVKYDYKSTLDQSFSHIDLKSSTTQKNNLLNNKIVKRKTNILIPQS